MPRGDGTGPEGKGPGTGRGRMGGNKLSAGPNGQCVCTICGEKVPQQAGVPWYQIKCPKCGNQMMTKQ